MTAATEALYYEAIRLDEAWSQTLRKAFGPVRMAEERYTVPKSHHPAECLEALHRWQAAQIAFMAAWRAEQA